MRKVSLVAVLFAGAVLFYASPDLPYVGDPESPAATHVSDYYIEHAVEDTATPNVVTPIIADYRGFDTLGETTVIMTAGLACLLILGRKSRRSPKKMRSFGSRVLDAAARLLTPYIMLFGLYVLFHGHHSPGGGFQGGTMLAAAVILVRLVRGRTPGWGLDRNQALATATLGTFVYALVGFVAMMFSGNFLDYAKLPMPMAAPDLRSLGILGVEIGVTLGVAGTMILIFDTLHAPSADPDSAEDGSW